MSLDPPGDRNAATDPQRESVLRETGRGAVVDAPRRGHLGQLAARRGLARLFDLALLGLAATIAGIAGPGDGPPLETPGALFGFAVVVGAEIWLTATRGRSPGKLLFAVRVHRRFADEVGWAAAAARSIPLLCLPLPVLWAVAPLSWVWGLATPDGRALHDLLAGTEVFLAVSR